MEYLAVVDGISGAGKTTAINNASETLTARGLSVVSTHDRTDEPNSREIDRLIQTGDYSPAARMLLFLAARRQTIDKKIKPNLRHTDLVIVDHYFPSTIAYQAHAEGLDPYVVKTLALVSVLDALPNRTFILDLDADLALSRMQTRGENIQVFDGLDRRFHERAREGYVSMAEHFDSFELVDASQSRELVAEHISSIILSDLSSS
jgi:dTMP kinase